MTENTSKKILVVDDEKETLVYLTNILKRLHYEIVSATAGKEAVTLAKDLKPDLIILDIVLPDMDGGEVAFTLSKDPSTARIPIIFLTGILKKKEEAIVKKTGSRYILAKPVAAQELLVMINKVLPR